MNILIYTQKSSYEGHTVGGAETSLRLLAEKLAARGHKVVYLTEQTWGRLPRYSVRRVNGVEVHLVGYANLPSKGWRPLLKMREKLARRRFESIAERLIRKNRIELVHTYHEIPGMDRFLRLREIRGLDYATVLRMGGKFWEQQLQADPGLHDRFRHVFNDTDSINFNTAGMQELFWQACRKLNLDVELRDSLVHDIGVENGRLNVRWSPPGTGPFTMVMASRFSHYQKRQDILVQALALLPDGMPVRLFLVGDGPNKSAIERMAADLRVPDGRIEFIPYLNQQELWSLMARCHLYIHACDFEGLSKIIAEAMGMGLPVMASDVVPLNDYVKDGSSGFLVENSPRAWADKISAASRDRILLENMSQHALELSRRHFNADENVKGYITYFENLSAGRRT